MVEAVTVAAVGFTAGAGVAVKASKVERACSAMWPMLLKNEWLALVAGVEGSFSSAFDAMVAAERRALTL